MKPIFITPEEKQSLIQEFTKALDGGMYDGTFSFTKSYSFTAKDHEKAQIIYTPEAFAKTIMLIHSFDSEVAWHALIERGQEPNQFIVFDVMVYPQEVTGATVNTDDEGYAQFMISLTDDEAAYMHAQCHSHVNMGTSPSGVDTRHQQEVLQTMNGKGFYLFQIWNKRLEVNSFIYDFDNNVMYENKDITFDITDTAWSSVSSFLADAKKLVKTKYTGYQSNVKPLPAANTQKPTYSWTPGVDNSSAAKKAKAGKPKSKQQIAAETDRYTALMDDDDDPQYSYGGYGEYYMD